MAHPIVKVTNGKIQGKENKNCDGDTYYSFQGIRYAKPPVKELRFKAPQPPEPWENVWDATKERSRCYSRHEFFRHIVGSEDCLYLNVYTPKLPQNGNNSRLAVMVWIHGGGYIMSSGNTELFGPEFLVAEDIVLVTFNYRLGYLGFLSVSNPEVGIPGNAGLKDMLMALEWVQQNISQFGGDPNCVTVFGQSAGASAVQTLMLSPRSKGLFHRAISQCGTALHAWNTAPDRSKYFLSYLGLDNIEDSREVLEKLQNLTLEKILDAQENCIPIKDIYVGESNPVVPVIERASEEAVITEPFEDIIKKGFYNHVPHIMGYNTHEGTSMTINGVPWALNCKIIDNELLVPRDLGLLQGSQKAKTIGDRIKEHYYGDEKPGTNNIFKYIEYCTDIWALFKGYTVSKLFASTSTQPVYAYRFSLDTELNVMKKVLESPYAGPVHGDEIGYLFTNEFVSKDLRPGSVEQIAKNRFVKLWTSFAKTGDPNPAVKDPLINVVWKPIKKGDYSFLLIGRTLFSSKVTMQIQNRIKFWLDLYNEIKGQDSVECCVKDW